MSSRTDCQNQPLNIYELHLGSFRKPAEAADAWYRYEELSDHLIPYLKDKGRSDPQRIARSGRCGICTSCRAQPRQYSIPRNCRRIPSAWRLSSYGYSLLVYFGGIKWIYMDFTQEKFLTHINEWSEKVRSEDFAVKR